MNAEELLAIPDDHEFFRALLRVPIEEKARWPSESQRALAERFAKVDPTRADGGSA